MFVRSILAALFSIAFQIICMVSDTIYRNRAITSYRLQLPSPLGFTVTLSVDGTRYQISGMTRRICQLRRSRQMKRLAVLVASKSGKASANEAAACISRGHFKGCAVYSDNYTKEVQPLSNEIEVNESKESVKETCASCTTPRRRAKNLV